MMQRLLVVLVLSGSLLGAGYNLYAATSTEKEIPHLLGFIADSDCRFIRNGSDYSAIDAKAHIERKFNHVKSRIHTTEEFIEHAASQSSFSGTPYRVNCAGKELLSKDWLTAELNRYRGVTPIPPH
jgi:Family of unknown function (DUF5329)